MRSCMGASHVNDARTGIVGLVLLPRVGYVMGLLHLYHCDSGIDLGGREVGVAEHLPYGGDVRAVSDQGCGEAVAEDVGGDMLIYTRLSCIGLHHVMDYSGGERFACAVDKEFAGLFVLAGQPGTHVGNVLFEKPACMFAQRDHSVPGALALVDPEHAALEVAVKDGEIDQLLKSDAGPVEDLKDSPVTDSERGGEIRHVQYLSGLLFAQYRSRQPCFLLRLFDILGGVDKDLV